MDVRLYDMISRRKSFHLFRGLGLTPIPEDELDAIRAAYAGFEPLCPGIRTAIRILPVKQADGPRGAEYSILLYSEKKGPYLRNAGYLGEQLDLYLVSRNIGTLWYGIGKPRETTYDGLDYVIQIAIAKAGPDTQFRTDLGKVKRRPLSETWNGPLIDGVSDLARFAPSACNSQPWYVENGETLAVYRRFGRLGIMPPHFALYLNRIDMGIYLCFLELCLMHRGIGFTRELFPDDGKPDALTRNAVYTLNA